MHYIALNETYKLSFIATYQNVSIHENTKLFAI